jgi:hypothetical protein
VATVPNPHHEFWPRERAGYEDRRTVAYAGSTSARSRVPWAIWEVRLASLIAAAGMIWAARAVAASSDHLDAVWQTRGPLETCAVGLLVWLHAKWQLTTKLR